MKKVITVLICLLLATALYTIPTLAETAQDAGEKDVKVALCIANTLGDRGFFDSADEGLKALEADYGVVGSVVECKSDASMYQMALVNAAEANDIVVAVGWEFWDAMSAVAPEYPNVKFLFLDNGLDGVGDNLMSITYAENQGSFLAGYIAMKMSKTGKVGVVGGEDSETINNFVVGYKQGALYAKADGVVLSPIYTEDYESPDKGKEAALSLYGQGADVVFQVAGKTGLGVFEAAEETGNFAIGVDSDQKYIKPEVILCSMVKEVGQSMYGAIAGYISDGTFEGGEIWNADMSTGYVGIAYGDDTMTQQIPAELKAEVDVLRDKIISGDIVVDSTR